MKSSMLLKQSLYAFASFFIAAGASYAANVTFPNAATNFGSVNLGSSKTTSFTLKNTSSKQVVLDSYWFNNSNSYSVVGGTCGFKGYVLSALKSCTVDLKFTPQYAYNNGGTFVVGYYLGTTTKWSQSALTIKGTGVVVATPPPPATQTGWLHVEGNQILNELGQPVVLKGVNIADVQHLNTKPWERPNMNARSNASLATDQYYAEVVRIPVLPGNSSYPDEGFFSAKTGGEAYFRDHLAPLVNELTAKGIYVIIDLHYVSDYKDLYPKVKEFWTFMAPKFSNNPYVMYEIFNEPILPDNWATWKNTIAQPATDLIRSFAPKNLVLVGGPYWSSHMQGAATDPVVGKNIVYIGHVYGNQTPAMWETRYMPVIKKYPFFVTEWGFEKGGTEGGDINYGTQFESWMRTNNLSWTVWSFDTLWGPRMFNSDWTLKDSPNGMGTFVRDLLLEEHQK